MSATPLTRRWMLVAFALAFSILLMRSQISSALVMRGDDFSVRAEASRAEVYYRRALWLDEKNGVAVDRLSFNAVMTHQSTRIRAALQTMSAYLKSAPNDAAVLFDRAMAEESLREHGRAEHDFVRVGELTSDPRAYTFAGFGALGGRNYAQARKWWKRALQIDAHFIPAQRALARVP